jgi:hypothetical protein
MIILACLSLAKKQLKSVLGSKTFRKAIKKTKMMRTIAFLPGQHFSWGWLLALFLVFTLVIIDGEF